MKPDSGYNRTTALRGYIEAVAGLLGVEPGACWSEYGDPSTAYIALACTAPGHPGQLLMAQWDSDSGWCLALEPGGGEVPIVVARWARPVTPEPVVVARRMHRVLGTDAKSTSDRVSEKGG